MMKAMSKLKSFAYPLLQKARYASFIKSFEKANNVKIKYEITKRRPGDIDACYADPTKAFKEIGFKATKDIYEMCKDSYNFIKSNKN